MGKRTEQARPATRIAMMLYPILVPPTPGVIDNASLSATLWRVSARRACLVRAIGLNLQSF